MSVKQNSIPLGHHLAEVAWTLSQKTTA